jgi:hypothetical protein
MPAAFSTTAVDVRAVLIDLNTSRKENPTPVSLKDTVSTLNLVNVQKISPFI